MQRLVLDFETFWTKEYSLSKMTPLEYIMDPRFEVLGCAVFDPEDKLFWVPGPGFAAFVDKVDWEDTIVLSHNALFDMSILAYRYGVVPAMYIDTLAMARNWISHATGSASLAACAQYYGFKPKGDTAMKTQGLDYATIRQIPELHEELLQYAGHDADLCFAIFSKMMFEGFPIDQLYVIDMVVRMVTEPKFDIDRMVLSSHLNAVKAKKAQLLEQIAMKTDNIGALMSDTILAKMLLAAGLYDVPRKISKTTGKEAYAFAKTDREFTDLLEHEDPYIQALVAARLGHKSTLEETRTERLIDLSLVTARLPVPLRYSGAHTHRFSGDWKINLQNLPNDSELRYALRAPPGYLVVSVDASQIEARINAALAEELPLLADFACGVDVYAKFAEELYGYEIDKRRHKVERFVGKTAILSLGYGSSWPVFQNMCRVKGKVNLTDAEAATIVSTYRNRFPAIKRSWKYANDTIIPAIANGRSIGWGPVIIERNAIALPNGNRLYYHDLRHMPDEKGNLAWTFKRGAKTHKIYGAKLVENVVQALAFVRIMEAALMVSDITEGMVMPAHQVHDELIYVVPEKQAVTVMELVKKAMSASPQWMPDLPLAAEGSIGRSYGDMKA